MKPRCYRNSICPAPAFWRWEKAKWAGSFTRVRIQRVRHCFEILPRKLASGNSEIKILIQGDLQSREQHVLMQNNSDIINKVIFQSLNIVIIIGKETQTQSISECCLIENTKHQTKNNVLSIWTQSPGRKAASAVLLC